MLVTAPTRMLNAMCDSKHNGLLILEESIAALGKYCGKVTPVGSYCL